MEKKYIQFFSIFLFYGISGLAFSGIGYLIFTNVSKYKYTEDIYEFPVQFMNLFSNWKNTGIAVGYMISIGIEYLEMFNIIYKENVMVQNMVINLYLFIYWLNGIIANFEVVYFIISLFGCLSLIIGALIYIEFVTVLVWRMDENTKEAIYLRASDDRQQLQVDEKDQIQDISLDNIVIQ